MELLNFEENEAKEFISNEIPKLIHHEPLLNRDFIFYKDLANILNDSLKVEIIIDLLKEQGWEPYSKDGRLPDISGAVYTRMSYDENSTAEEIFNKICKYHPITHYKYFNTRDIVPEIEKLTIFKPNTIILYLAFKFDLTNIACTYDGVRGWKFNGVFEENPTTYVQKWKIETQHH